MAATFNAVQEIEQAITRLSAEELSELYSWLELHCPQPLDMQLDSDLQAGRLDGTIFRALDEEKSGRVRPL